MEKTIDQLREELEKRLQSIPCLSKFYIGETDEANLTKTTNRHENEGYSSTIPIAKGEHSVVSKAEETLIKYFKENSKLKDKNGNNDTHSLGSKAANIVYVSIRITPRKDIELDDDDMYWPEVYQLI